MSDEIRRRRGLNYLGELGAKLRDLRGTATLAHELIQNAEDAIKDISNPSNEQATLVFRIDQDYLIVDNGGVFSDCRQQDEPICPWKSAGGRPCDFHSFADVGGGAKRRASNLATGQSGLKGAFGFGFTAVYQVTDHPHLISNGRHWILEDEKSEDERILECNRPDCEYCRRQSLPGTRFILPWAYDPKSPIRVGLNAPAVSKEKPGELVSELEQALPQTMLFLDHLRETRVFCQGCEKTSVKIGERAASVVSVTTNGELSKWVLLTHDFVAEAIQLRVRHPAGEKNPSTLVKIAVPQTNSSDGLFFAYLPTQMATGVPFHVNADFFPTNDRKRLLLEKDYQGDWNRAAIKAGAVALGNGLLSLRSHLGPKCFWNMLKKVKDASSAESVLGSSYWDHIRPQLSKEEVVHASDGNWYSASCVRLVSEGDALRFSELHSQIGILGTHPDLDSYRSLLSSPDVGVRLLDCEDIAKGLLNRGLTGERSISEFPEYFRSLDNWKLLWQQVGEATARDSSFSATVRSTIRAHKLMDCSLVKCMDGFFRPIRSTFHADLTTRTLFASLGHDLKFACDDEVMHRALSPLIQEFSVSHAIDCIQGLESKSITIPKEKVADILQWFNNRVGDFKQDSRLVQAFRALSLCPTADGLQSFDKVVLPGGFSDPIGITSVAESQTLKIFRSLIDLLNLRSLSLEEYVTEWLPEAFEEFDFEATVCSALILMLSKHQGELYTSASARSLRDALRGLKCILCDDGKLHSAGEGLFFRTDLVFGVLGNAVTYVDASLCSDGVLQLLEWLGVESRPSLDRVIKRLDAITTKADENPSTDSVASVEALLEHLGGRVEEIRRHESLLTRLQAIPCIWSAKRWWNAKDRKWESIDMRWAVPKDVTHNRVRSLVETVARFPRLSSQFQDKHRDLLVMLRVVDRPKASAVLDHLRQSVKQGGPIDARVYQFLNRALHEGELAPSVFKDLKSLKCLYDPKSDKAFKPKDCFSKEHPFGNRRVLVNSDDLTTLTELLRALEIRPSPSWSDAIEVIYEIAHSDAARNKKKISIDDKHVLHAGWRMIDSALRDSQYPTDQVLQQLNRLSGLPVVCRTDTVLASPQRVFFRDREYLAEAFSKCLNAELIRMPQGAIDALTKAGVRKLSEVTEINVIHDEAASGEADEVKRRIQERASLLLNILETSRASKTKPSTEEFENLVVIESSQLTVELTFCGFEKPLPPVRHPAWAVIDRERQILRYRLDDGSIPWDAIACELARMCLERDDVTQLSAAFSSAMEPESRQKAERKLCLLGFAAIEQTEAIPHVTPVSTGFSVGAIQQSSELLASQRSFDDIAEGNRTTSTATTSPSPSISVSPNDAIIVGPAMSPMRPQVEATNRIETDHDSRTPRENSTQCDRVTLTEVQGDRSHSPDTLLKTRTSETGLAKWLASQPGTSEKRQAKIREVSTSEPRRNSMQLLRTQRINQVGREEVYHYLRDLYSFDGVLICQMRCDSEGDLHPMPFRKKDAEQYWGKEELFNRELSKQLPFQLPEDVRLFLFLCPNCASLFTEFVSTQPSEQRRLLKWVAESEGQTTFDLNCSLSGLQPNRTIHFHPKHLDDIRSVDGVVESATH